MSNSRAVNESLGTDCTPAVTRPSLTPTVIRDDERPWTQVLRIEIDCGTDYFHGNHTPGIVGVLRHIADECERIGVQFVTYPWEVRIREGAPLLALVNLDEAYVAAPESGPTSTTGSTGDGESLHETR